MLCRNADDRPLTLTLSRAGEREFQRGLRRNDGVLDGDLPIFPSHLSR